MIRRILFAFLLMLLSSCPCFSQSPSDGGAGDDKVVRKSLLLSDLQALEAKADKIAAPLSRARAQAEIADAAWPLDREWAKKLLREAYELILPPEEERCGQSEEEDPLQVAFSGCHRDCLLVEASRWWIGRD